MCMYVKKKTSSRNKPILLSGCSCNTKQKREKAEINWAIVYTYQIRLKLKCLVSIVLFDSVTHLSSDV